MEMGKWRLMLLLGVAVFLVISPVLFASPMAGGWPVVSAGFESGAPVSEADQQQVGDGGSEAAPEMSVEETRLRDDGSNFEAVPATAVDEPERLAAEIESLQFRIDLLHQALAPDNPDAAIRQYTEGLKTRNGALELASMSPELRKQKEASYRKMRWITGTSSPWIEQIRIIQEAENPDGSYTYHLQLYWRTSTEPEQPEDWSRIPHETVVVSEVDGYWYVTDLPGEHDM